VHDYVIFTSPISLHSNSSLVTNIRLELDVQRNNCSSKIFYNFSYC